MIDKRTVIICSTGRTGTTFFAHVLPSIIPDAFCVHEPDVWSGFSKLSLDRIKQFGLYHMVLGRLLGKTGLRTLSQNFISGAISSEAAAASLHKQRERYYNATSSELIVESNGQWFGLLPLMPQVFSQYRFVGIVRDPRSWLASTMNYGWVHGPKDQVAKFGGQRLNPSMMSDIGSPKAWEKMDRFERICWTWTATNTALEKAIALDENARLYRFEDLFHGPDRLSTVENMVRFMTRFDDRQFTYRIGERLLDRRVNAAERETFSDWPKWTQPMARTMNDLCGELMSRHGYGAEPEWRALLQ